MMTHILISVETANGVLPQSADRPHSQPLTRAILALMLFSYVRGTPRMFSNNIMAKRVSFGPSPPTNRLW